MRGELESRMNLRAAIHSYRQGAVGPASVYEAIDAYTAAVRAEAKREEREAIVAWIDAQAAVYELEAKESVCAEHHHSWMNDAIEWRAVASGIRALMGGPTDA